MLLRMRGSIQSDLQLAEAISRPFCRRFTEVKNRRKRQSRLSQIANLNAPADTLAGFGSHFEPNRDATSRNWANRDSRPKQEDIHLTEARCQLRTASATFKQAEASSRWFTSRLYRCKHRKSSVPEKTREPTRRSGVTIEMRCSRQTDGSINLSGAASDNQRLV
jgi:hypothetical protein